MPYFTKKHPMEYDISGRKIYTERICRKLITLSLCMIVKNEESVLARCLKSAEGVFDEIIVTDTSSDDKTVEVAESFGARVNRFDWCDDFAAARNFSFSTATMSHIMWLDADDVLPPATAAGLISLKASLSSDTDFVMMPYNAAFDDDGRPTLTYMRERIVRNGAFVWKGAVHEAIEPRGKIVYSDLAVEHRKAHAPEPGRNLRIYSKMLERGDIFTVRDKFYFAREMYYAGKYKQAKSMLRRFIAAGEGWVENRIEAYRTLAYIYRAENRPERALRTLLVCIGEGNIKAELCCEIGELFLERADWSSAVFWYRSALGLAPDTQSGAFVNPDCSGYIPSLQLCVCYDRMGDMKTAKMYNDMAGAFKPESKAYLANKIYFDNFGKD